MLAEERRTGSARSNLDRNLSFELARVTEAAALASARWMGKGDKIAADQAAVNAMRFALDSVDMDGIVVIGEGEKDEAPMLYTGERIGNGLPPETDIAVDPIDGTTLLSKGLPNSVSVVALAKRGSMLGWKGIAYMEKIAVGPAGKGHVSLELSVEENLKSLASAKKVRRRRPDGGDPGARPPQRDHPAGPRGRRAGQADHRRRHRRRDHAVAGRDRHGHAARDRRLARGGHDGLRAEVPGRRHPVPATGRATTRSARSPSSRTCRSGRS